MSKYVLGIDTSNYKTSVAVIDDSFKVIYDARTFLKVKKGERGLRQSDAFFQHVKELPELIGKIPVDLAGQLEAVFWSDRPRPVEGSYMPVFTAGESIGKSIAMAFGVPGAGFSHQEGHIEAIRHGTDLGKDSPFLACHFSGGTTEILLVSQRPSDVIQNTGIFYNIEIVGGTMDIAYGQVIDRAGVAMGLPFPSGEYIDMMAIEANSHTEYLTKVKAMNAKVNLSGIDSQIKRVLENGLEEDKRNPFAREIMIRLYDSIVISLVQAVNITGINEIIMAGGVSSSGFLRKQMKSDERLGECRVYFGRGDLSQDNAVGTALLGGRYLWD